MLEASISVADPKGLVTKAFLPEDREIKGKASYTVTRKGGRTIFRISASDSVALRTVMNSITKMLGVIEKMQGIR